MPQPRFFDLDEYYARLNERDPLVKLNRIMTGKPLKALLAGRQRDRN